MLELIWLALFTLIVFYRHSRYWPFEVVGADQHYSIQFNIVNWFLKRIFQFAEIMIYCLLISVDKHFNWDWINLMASPDPWRRLKNNSMQRPCSCRGFDDCSSHDIETRTEDQDSHSRNFSRTLIASWWWLMKLTNCQIQSNAILV